MADLTTRLDRRALLTGDVGPAPPPVVRPPGAVAADRFAVLCDGCGDCAAACPANAIQLSAEGDTPQIVAVEAPCLMCDGFPCAAACPTGALEPVTAETPRIALIRFDGDACWARQGLDPNCDYCFDRCPLKGRAITYRRGAGPTIDAKVCTGCGISVYFCPSQPTALATAPL